jgi:hypothetical protein
MSVSISCPSILPFQADAHLWLCGRWGEGGQAVLREGEHSASFRVAATLFDLLAILTLAARARPAAEEWAATGFLSIHEINRELTRRSGGDPAHPWYDSKGVIRAVYRLRGLVGQAWSPGHRTAGNTWARKFVENHPLLGYRLSAPADHLQLVILPGLNDGAALI